MASALSQLAAPKSTVQSQAAFHEFSVASDEEELTVELHRADSIGAAAAFLHLPVSRTEAGTWQKRSMRFTDGRDGAEYAIVYEVHFARHLEDLASREAA